MAQVFHTSYSVASVPANPGDLMVVRNVEAQIGLNHLYQLDKDGLWSQIRVPTGVSIVDFANQLSNGVSYT